MPKSIITLTLLVVMGIYLFVTAPAPLPEANAAEATIPIEKVLALLDQQNSKIRKLYTKEVVGYGKKIGVKFDEAWQEEEVVAGPLPAQFLRLMAQYFETKPLQLGLYLVSDYAINQANQLEGDSLNTFLKMKNSGQAVFSFAGDIERFTYMSPDVAVVKPCVQCHNEHAETPKKDWRIGDIMGATTWAFPDEKISYEIAMTLTVYIQQSAVAAYQQLLSEVRQLDNPPQIGEHWPRDGRFLPDEITFSDAVVREISSLLVKFLLDINAPPAGAKT